VTHDRRLLESVRVTRAVAIAGGSVIRTVPMGESRPSPGTAGETWRPV
jgi:hypothetical protein